MRYRPQLEVLEDRSLPAITLAADPIFTFNGPTVAAEGTLEGLSNKDIHILLGVWGSATITVLNQGGQPVPGAGNKIGRIALDASNVLIVPATAFTNGTYGFIIDATFVAPPLDLPNDKWTAVVNPDSLIYEKAMIWVTELPAGTGQAVVFGPFPLQNPRAAV